MPKHQPIETPFEAYLVKAGDDECWSWTGPVTNGRHPTLGNVLRVVPLQRRNRLK